MATRFRRRRTRKMKGRKGLKTRRHRGGDFAGTMQNMFNKAKGTLGNMTSKGKALLGSKNAMPTSKKANEFSFYMGNLPGGDKESRTEFVRRMKAMGKK
jgi:hypothetical protein